MLKLKLASAILAATFVSAGSVYAFGVIPSEGDSGGLSIRPLPQDTHATPPVGFPTGVSEIGNVSEEWRTDKTNPGFRDRMSRVPASGEYVLFPYLPDGAQLPPGN